MLQPIFECKIETKETDNSNSATIGQILAKAYNKHAGQIDSTAIRDAIINCFENILIKELYDGSGPTEDFFKNIAHRFVFAAINNDINSYINRDLAYISTLTPKEFKEEFKRSVKNIKVEYHFSETPNKKDI